MKQIVYGYIRVSSEKQVEQGFGLEAQKYAIEQYVKEHDMILGGIYRDEGISGAAGMEEEINRPGLIELLANHEVKTIITKHSSRMWRDVYAYALVSRELIKKNIELICIDQPEFNFRNPNPQEKFMENIMAAVDELERMMILARLAGGREAKVKGGVRGCGGNPIGYIWSDDKKKPELIIDQQQAAIVKLIYDKYLALGSLGKLAAWLNSQGIKSPTGKLWQTAVLNQILTNRFYLGELTWKGSVFPGKHEPIINRVTFGKAQALLNRNNRKQGTTQTA